MSCRSRAVAIKGVHCILAGVHTTLAKCSYHPLTKHHSPLKNCKEAVDIESTLHIFESVASLLYRELGFPKQKNLGVQPKPIAMRRAKSKTNMLLNILSQSIPGGIGVKLKAPHVCFILILFTERRHVRRDTQGLRGEFTQYHRPIVENMNNNNENLGTCIFE